MKFLSRFILGLALISSAQAALVEKTVTYEQAGTTLEGFHVYNDALSGKRPAVLVIHQWTGLSENEKRRSRMLAEMGYNVFAADIYGKGIRPQPPEAGTEAGKYKSDRALFRARMMAALDVLKTDERTQPKKIAAIGYCFGGTGVLEMARAGADIAGVVSFHGGLNSQAGMTAQIEKVPAKILVLHGADDPYVKAAEVADFENEMTSAKADWQLVKYSGAVHSFTQKEAGNDHSVGAAYNESADLRSWAAMQTFFTELFNESAHLTMLRMNAAFDWSKSEQDFRVAADAAGFQATTLLSLEAGALIAWEKPGNGPHIYLSAGIHGDEPAGPAALLELMAAGFFDSSAHWSICPALNPSGLLKGTRENAEGIDLNRDYLQRSSSEIAAHAAWLDSLQTPDLFISLHEDWETRGFYFYEIDLHNDPSGRVETILNAVKPWFDPEVGPEIDGHEVDAPGWIYHPAEPDFPENWPEAIFMAKRGCPLSFTFETPSSAAIIHRVAAHVAGVRAICKELISTRPKT